MICDNSKKTEHLKISFYESIEAVNSDEWCGFVDNKNVYLSIPYLKVLEETLKEEVQPCYLLFHNSSNKLAAIAYFQFAKFIDQKSNIEDDICLVQGIIKSKILKKIEAKMLVCGNIFACGEHGFLYSSELSPSVAYSNFNRAIDQLKKTDKDKNFSIILMKEFWPETTVNGPMLVENNYSEFMIDVNMVLKIHPLWNDYNTYLQSMTTKFRTRANGVYKKSKSLVKKSFEVKDIRTYENRINELYGFVINKADYNFGNINAQAFKGFKENLKENFRFTGYFLDEELIGFSTAMISNKKMDANFVGLDYQYNSEYALYQRMLYDFVDLSITENLKELRLGRTAEEIKSCLGAKPIDMKLFIKHKNTVPNTILKQMIKSVKPSEFVLRKPFKANFI
ncbi:MAG: hypothetical protein ACPGSL_07965 [Vicingaceae bacterium]